MPSVLVRANIRALREWFRFSQQEFARALGVSERAVIRWEGGDTRPMRVAQRSLDLLDDLRTRLIKRFGESRAQTWLGTANRSLRGSSPREVLLVSGPLPVRDLMVGAEAGTYR